VCPGSRMKSGTHACEYFKNKKPRNIRGLKFVPGTGIEPAHPCERQILSLLRLPIPPPGHFFGLGCNIKASKHSSQNPFQIFFLVVIIFHFQ
jgi:hypothetical protein